MGLYSPRVVSMIPVLGLLFELLISLIQFNLIIEWYIGYQNVNFSHRVPLENRSNVGCHSNQWKYMATFEYFILFIE